jgi:hypothetical protein
MCDAERRLDRMIGEAAMPRVSIDQQGDGGARDDQELAHPVGPRGRASYRSRRATPEWGEGAMIVVAVKGQKLVAECCSQAGQNAQLRQCCAGPAGTSPPARSEQSWSNVTTPEADPFEERLARPSARMTAFENSRKMAQTTRRAKGVMTLGRLGPPRRIHRSMLTLRPERLAIVRPAPNLERDCGDSWDRECFRNLS